MKKSNTYKLCVSAVLIALSTVLSMLKIVQMPLGGSVTLLSMLPVALIPLLCGFPFGIVSALVYAGIQIFVDNPFAWGLTPAILIGSIVFDYIVAFGVLSLSGLFAKKGDMGVVLGIVFAIALRFISHFISGFIFFANLEQFYVFGNAFSGQPVLYSLCYNAFYMVPEMVFTAIGTLIFVKTGGFKQVKKMINR